MPFTLEELLPNDQQLRTVQMHETVTHAIDLMHRHGYSQLPVVEPDGKISRGQVVTFDGILHCVQSFKTQPEMLQVKDVARRVRTYAPDADLLATLDDIQRDNFALIVDEADALTGIVTTADTTVFFREYAQDLMQIEGIEARMKEAIAALFAGDDAGLETTIAKVTDRAADIRRKLRPAILGYLEKTGLTAPEAGSDTDAVAEAERRLALPKAGKAFDQLTMDEIIKVLLDHPNAPKLSKATGVTELRGLLEQVRDVRNKLAHFRGELSGEERRLIIVASEWLEQNLPTPAPLATIVTPAVSPVVPTPPAHEESDDDTPHGTYAALSAHLAGQPGATPSLQMTFQDIERVLGKELPRSAYEYRAWWANDPTKPQSAAWLDEGWRANAISMTDRRLTFVRTNDREESYIEFFAALNARLKTEAGFLLREVSPQGANWQILATLPWLRPESVNINASFTRRKELRIELYLDCGNKEQNKQRFDELLDRKDAIETAMGEPLHWERMDTKRSSRVAVYTKGQILTDFESETLITWATKKAMDFHRVFTQEFPNETLI